MFNIEEKKAAKMFYCLLRETEKEKKKLLLFYPRQRELIHSLSRCTHREKGQKEKNFFFFVDTGGRALVSCFVSL